MKKTKRINLSECSDEEMVDYITMSVAGDDVAMSDEVSTTVAQPVSANQTALLKKRLSQYISMLRAMQLWYHAAHHVTRGSSFFGDHADLYGKLYSELTDDFDKAVEKAIGLTNDEEMACPVCITQTASQILGKYPSPVTLTALAQASTALEMEKNHNELVSAIFDELKKAGALSLGLDDMLMATVNDHEGYIYFLQQRVKTELEN